jgi:large subunit ribosomal protein L15
VTLFLLSERFPGGERPRHRPFAPGTPEVDYLARNSKKLGYEGGQMPLLRRVPKKRGFTNPNREAWAVVNVERLAQRFEADATVSPEAMAEAGLVRGRLPVKVLGRGDLDRALTVQAHAFSSSARQKIEQAGGKAEVLGG